MIRETEYYGTYDATEETEQIRSLLLAAVADGEKNGDRYPYTFWTDEQGWLYLKWKLENSFQKPIVRYKYTADNELISEVINENPDAERILRGENKDDPVVLITGDTHGVFGRIIKFCEAFPTQKEDVMIILGDAGINYSGDWNDIFTKKHLAHLPITLFCIHGNHEMRPEKISTYKLTTWMGGKVYVEDAYPNIIFAKDGEVYNIAGKKVLVIGGAYSVDKWYRLQTGRRWYEDEQPSEETKQYVEQQLEKCNWNVDVVLSHTTPFQMRPIDMFLPTIDQSTVDYSTEEWLTGIEEKLTYEKWYAGHYHCDRTEGKLQIMYRKVELFCGDRDLNFSEE